MNVADEMLGHAKTTVEAIGERFTDPRDDWDNVMLAECGDGTRALVALLVNDSEEMAAAIMAFMLEQEVRSLVLVQSVWRAQKHGTNPFTGEQLDIKDTPGREELVTLMLAEKGGRMEMHAAKINRFKDRPPTLAPWEQMDDALSYGGRFPDAIRTGFGGD